MTKRQYNYGYEQKAKIAARKAVREKEKEIEKLKKKLENKKYKLKKKTEAISKVDKVDNPVKNDKQGTVVTESEYNELPQKVKTLFCLLYTSDAADD